MGEVLRLPGTTLTNSSSPERCPHCGREKQPKTLELLGVYITVTPSCSCEIEAFDREMERFKQYHQREALRRLLAESGLTGSAAGCTFESFLPRLGTERALKVARDFAARFEEYRKSGEGFVLIGTYGNGKSHLAAAVVHRLVSRGIPASYQPVPELLKRVRATYDGSGETEGEILDLLQSVQCLVLDDVGAQKQTPWAEEFLYTVIDHRYRHKLPTLITSNCSAVDGEESLTAALGGRAVDRILERNIIIRVTATSYRRELAKRRLEREKKGGTYCGPD